MLKANKTSKVLRIAAEMVHETGLGCCSVLATLEHRSYQHLETMKTVRKARQVFESLYKPATISLYWFGEPYLHPNVDHRVTALLLAAAISESEGD